MHFMESFKILGPSKLKGEIQVSGSKNAALPIIAATILSPGVYEIKNVPEITDITRLLEILIEMGAKAELKNNICKIDTININTFEPNPSKVRKIRASVVLLGPLLARFGEVKVAQPGGCFIGARPITTHLESLKELGAKIVVNPACYHLKTSGLKGKKIILNEFSVTGTENIIMAATLADGVTEIRLCATEPHVIDLCNFLIKMGADIKGIGTHTIIIKGKKALHPANHTLIYDQIEAGTLAITAAVSRGKVIIKGFITDHHDIFLKKLSEAKVNFDVLDEKTLSICPSTSFKAVNLRTDIYPGFPTDLQAPFAILMTQAEGSNEIYETMFESRLNYISELNKMGANAVIRNSHQATITGPTPLYGTTITSFDLRAGATLIIAALIAQGESTIEQIELVDRGYEKIDERLNMLGAKIVRVTK